MCFTAPSTSSPMTLRIRPCPPRKRKPNPSRKAGRSGPRDGLREANPGTVTQRVSCILWLVFRSLRLRRFQSEQRAVVVWTLWALTNYQYVGKRQKKIPAAWMEELLCYNVITKNGFLNLRFIKICTVCQNLHISCPSLWHGLSFDLQKAARCFASFPGSVLSGVFLPLTVPLILSIRARILPPSLTTSGFSLPIGGCLFFISFPFSVAFCFYSNVCDFLSDIAHSFPWDGKQLQFESLHRH